MCLAHLAQISSLLLPDLLFFFHRVTLTSLLRWSAWAGYQAPTILLLFSCSPCSAWLSCSARTPGSPPSASRAGPQDGFAVALLESHPPMIAPVNDSLHSPTPAYTVLSSSSSDTFHMQHTYFMYLIYTCVLILYVLLSISFCVKQGMILVFRF